MIQFSSTISIPPDSNKHVTIQCLRTIDSSGNICLAIRSIENGKLVISCILKEGMPNFLLSCFYFQLPLFYDSHILYLKEVKKGIRFDSVSGSDIPARLFVKSYFLFKLLKQGRYSFFCSLCLLYISSNCNVQNVTFETFRRLQKERDVNFSFLFVLYKQQCSTFFCL
jgi:hypothetical protein